MTEVTTQEHRAAAMLIRELLAAYRDHEDLISIGAYRRGSNPSVDTAIDMIAEINQFLQQPISERVTLDAARKGLVELALRCRERMQAAPSTAPTTAASDVGDGKQ